jgi:stage III sporulation protein SpoIIIAA
VTPDELRADRESYVSRVVESTSHRRLIVAGPGTGKTTAFARALNGDSKGNRILTFIRNLRAIAMDVAASLLSIAVIQIAQVQHQTFTHVLQAGAAF